MFEQTGCTAFQCHGGFVASAGTFVLLSDPFTGYRDMIDRVSGRRPEVQVKPFAPDESVLVEHAETTLRTMRILQPPQIDLVRRWVAEGAAYSREVDLDAGPGGNPPQDASLPDGGPTVCSVEGLRGHPALPAACLPRCSQATWDAIVACRSNADPAGCQRTVIAADTMRPVALSGTFEPVSLNCDTCLTWQTMSCVYDMCPWELLALQRCRAFRSSDPCDTERNAMNACIARSPNFTACQRTRDSQCVPR